MGGEPWFPAKDVCDALGIKNPRAAVEPLNEGQAQHILKSVVSSVGNSDISWPNRGMACVSKKGLYKLLFWSRKPAALDFQDWVTDVVLPAIEKDGMYVRDEEKVETEEDLMAMSLRVMEGRHNTDENWHRVRHQVPPLGGRPPFGGAVI
ncbi:hypothetical protein KUW11_02645 [Maritimibacter alkaliphilus]|nr:hypothetical protein [Maritimibacter alkaliphilus]